MRTKYTLWKASNGWILVPEGTGDGGIKASDVPNIVVFKTLDEFAKFTPKRVRNRKTKTVNATKAVRMAVTPEDLTNANIH